MDATVDYYLQQMTEQQLPQVFANEQVAYEFPWSLKGFENALDHGLNYVILNKDDVVIGHVCLLPVLDEITLMNLCVAPEFQRQGVAAWALRNLLGRLADAGYRHMFLEVRESNHPARSLYQALGFQEDGVRKNYYPSWTEIEGQKVLGKEHAVLMSKQF